MALDILLAVAAVACLIIGLIGYMSMNLSFK
jgi:hypothetical protein